MREAFQAALFLSNFTKFCTLALKVCEIYVIIQTDRQIWVYIVSYVEYLCSVLLEVLSSVCYIKGATLTISNEHHRNK